MYILILHIIFFSITKLCSCNKPFPGAGHCAIWQTDFCLVIKGTRIRFPFLSLMEKFIPYAKIIVSKKLFQIQF